MDEKRDTSQNLRQDLHLLRHQLEALEKRLAQLEKMKFESHSAALNPPPLPTPVPAPEPVPPARHPAEERNVESAPMAPPPIPAHLLEDVPISAADPGLSHGQNAPQTPPRPPPDYRRAPEPAAMPRESLELQLGKHIIPVVGIVVLLTGFVFAGGYVYQNFIREIGPWGKILALYMVSGGLFGLGLWLENRFEQVKNYARLLMGGGCAAAYYTTYAAHYVPNLRIVESPVVGGLLLLAAAGLIVWQAAKRQSETLAVIAILLGFYTSSINEVRAFTLVSNLVLCGAAVVFIVRYGWSRLSVLSLVAAYASYFYWRFFAEGFPWWRGGPLAYEDYLFGTAFLTCYWLMFLCAGLRKLVRPEDPAVPPIGFLILNNSAYFALYFLTTRGGYQDHFWLFAVVFGLVLTGLSVLIRLRLPEERKLEAVFLTKGSAALTLGLIDRLRGPALSLTLAVESAVLLMYGSIRGMNASRVLSYLLSFGAVLYGIEKIRGGEYILGACLCAVMLWNAWWTSRRPGEAGTVGKPSGGGVYFALMSALTVWMTLRGEYRGGDLALLLALGAVVYAALAHILRTREISFAAHLLLIIGLVAWMTDGSKAALPWWNTVGLVAILLGLCRYWQKTDATREGETEGWQTLFAVYATGVVAILYFGASPHFARELWMVLCGVAGVGLLVYAVATRLWPLAVVSQFFMLASTYYFLRLLEGGHPSPWLTLVPLLLMGGVGYAARLYADRGLAPARSGPGIEVMGGVYQMAAGFMVICWVFEYIWRSYQPLVFLAGSAACLAWAQHRDRRALFGYGTLLAALGFFVYVFLLKGSWRATPESLIALLIFMGHFEGVKRLGWERALYKPLKAAGIVVGLMCLWLLWLHHWVNVMDLAKLRTVAWSVLAFGVFGAGLLIKERVYRLTGLLIMAAAVGRVFFVDLWGWGEIFRILSLIALAVVLLAVGYIYNRYQDKIREWL